MSKDRKFLFASTHFEDDPDRSAIPVVLACNALAGGAEDVWLWVTAQGVNLAIKDKAAEVPSVSFPPLAELLETFLEAGGKFGVCPPCGKTHGVVDDNMVEGAEWVGGAALIELMKDRETAWF